MFRVQIRIMGRLLSLTFGMTLLPLPVVGAELSKEEVAFLKAHTPRLLGIIREAEKNEYEEVLKEGIEWVERVQEEWEEAKGDGIPWAKLMVGEMANEAALEYLRWKLEEGEIREDKAEEAMRTLAEERVRIENGIMRQEIAWLEEDGEVEEAGELKEELAWRRENPRKAVEETIEEMQEEFDEDEDNEDRDDDDGGYDEEEIAEGEIYTPPPADRAEHADELAGVTYSFDEHIVTALETYCFGCHDAASAKGDLDLETALTQRPLVKNRLLWENVAERIRSGDMPPKKEAQPSAQDRLRLRAWLKKEVVEFDYATVRNPGYLPARRLTREEYNRTIRDLLGVDLRPADQFPMDFSGTSGFSNSANTLFLATAHLDRYLTSAELVIDAVRKNGRAWAQLRGEGSAEDALRRLVRRAFRRTPSDVELAEVRGRFAQARAAGKDEGEALAETFKFVLISPHFLLRVEEGSAAGEDGVVSSHDYAARLSYFLWASTPDDQLLDAAEAGKLGDTPGREKAIARLLADPRSLALGEIFAGEWLGTHIVGPRIRKDPIDNPWCTESLMKAMRDETAYFVHS